MHRARNEPRFVVAPIQLGLQLLRQLPSLTALHAEGRRFHSATDFHWIQKAHMARVTVEDCLEKEVNRFALVVLAARRTRQLMKGQDALVRSSNKFAVTSLREIAAGKVHFHRDTDEVVKEWLKETNPQGL